MDQTRWATFVQPEQNSTLQIVTNPRPGAHEDLTIGGVKSLLIERTHHVVGQLPWSRSCMMEIHRVFYVVLVTCTIAAIASHDNLGPSNRFFSNKETVTLIVRVAKRRLSLLVQAQSCSRCSDAKSPIEAVQTVKREKRT